MDLFEAKSLITVCINQTKTNKSFYLQSKLREAA